MSNKQELLTALRDEFNRWEQRLAGMTEDQITAWPPASDWSVKDVIAHLRAWQQISIARLEAVVLNRAPELPQWLAGMDPFEADSEAHLDEFNARIHRAHREEPWLSVHRAWREGYLRFLALGEAVPHEELLQAGRYPWLKGYPLSAVLQGAYEHHHEHRVDLWPDSGSTGY